MWSYYGRKTKVIKYYPDPIHDKIIEPFAGTAVYSLWQNNWKKDVLLIDKYDVVIKTWHYLQQAKKEDILSLPDMEYKDKVDDHEQLSQEEKWLIGWNINGGSAQPKKTAMKFNVWNRVKLQIADSLHKIKHWDIRQGDYIDLENEEATWYIDPPYQFGGQYYRHSNKKLDYNNIADWCKERNGQVIVCENTKADWLPFEPLKKMRGSLHTTTEAIWLKK
jgi:site-specific DNA-adenine methylase